MFRYVLALLVIHTYGRGLGIPLDPSPANLVKSLENLANNCESEFLSMQILNQKDNCNMMMIPPYSKGNQFQCLLFYDINSQLCSAIASAKLTVKEDDYKAVINVTTDVVHLCNTTKTWNITDLPNFPQYKINMPKILDRYVTCLKFCTNTDVESDDVNFYCKYFKWGSELLMAAKVATVQPSSNSNIVSGESAAIVSTNTLPFHNKSDAQVQTKEQASPQPVKSDVSADIKVSTKAIINEIPGSTNQTSAIKFEQLSKAVEPEAVNPELPSNGQVSGPGQAQSAPAEVKDVPPVAQEGTSSNLKPDPSKDDTETKMIAAQEEPPNREVVPEAETVANKPPVQVNEADPDDIGNEVDSEEGNDAFQDIQNSDDEEDPALDDFEKPKKEQTKLVIPKTMDNQIFNTDISRGEYLANMQDSFSDGDDDNFFPFFLTAVILVVVIYIIYHNKSKVTKLVLGLIVEGRQPGRRRNSRGHAYRRLDTLEQAMSTNTAAAPSRIIY